MSEGAGIRPGKYTAKAPVESNVPISDEETFSAPAQLYQTAPVGLCYLDRDLRYVRINNCLAAIHGCPVAAHLGRTVREVIPELADRIEPLLMEVLDTGKELLDIDFAGKQFTRPEIDAYWRASYYPVKDEIGHVQGISVVVQDVTDLRLKERALDERVQFERIVSRLSAMLINLPGEEIDTQIKEGLGLIGSFMDTDRCFIGQFSHDKTEFRITHLWCAPGILDNEVVLHMVPTEEVPWFSDRMLGGQGPILTSADEMPDSAVPEKACSKSVDSRSMAVAPLVVEGEVIGSFGFDMIGRQRQWPEDLQQRLQLAGEMFAGALTRQKKHTQIEELARFESQISKISFRFVNMPLQQIDAAIEDSLGQVGACLGTDFGTLLLYHPERNCYHVTHEWLGPLVSGDRLFKGADVNQDYPWLAAELEKCCPLFIHDLKCWPEEASNERAACEQVGIKSVLWVPFAVDDEIKGYVALNTLKHKRTWSDDFIQRLRLVGEIFANALLRLRSGQALASAFNRIEELKDRLESENRYLRNEVETGRRRGEIIGESKPVRQMLAQAEQVATTDSAVLLVGETGTGKEMLAREIHNTSSRSERKMVTVNCGALPAALIEAELFGREKGAYTGALTRQIGRFELADQSTLFLDEIGELPLELQIRLLRVLQDGTFERLGSTQTRRVDVRIISATNRDLAKEVRKGTFRADLFYRLNVFPITVPPLRERSEDIPALIWSFIEEFNRTMGKGIERVPVDAMQRMQRYAWPGNVRELRNAVERAMILTTGKILRFESRASAVVEREVHLSLEQVEKAHIEKILVQKDWCIGGKQGAAAILGLKPTTLRSRMAKLGIPFRKDRFR